MSIHPASQGALPLIFQQEHKNHDNEVATLVFICLMLCASLDWQYAELPSSASDAVLYIVLVCKMWVI